LSSFTSKQHGFENENNQEKSQGIKTLFVWKEWVRFIEYRRNVIDRTHVQRSAKQSEENGSRFVPVMCINLSKLKKVKSNRPTTELSEIDRLSV
jgi:hypothetical protein